MKVLLFIASQGWGGAEKVFVELANNLAQKCDLHVLLLKGTEYTDRFDQNVKITISTLQGSRRNPFLLINLYNSIKNIEPDIVHTHAAKATHMFYSLNRLLKMKHAATKHNARKGAIFNRVQWVTTVSEQARKTIHNTGTAEVIYNGIIPRTIDIQKKYTPFSLAAVGRLDAYKGFDILIREVSKLRFDFILNIAGEGEERSKLEKLIKNLQLEQKVFLLGHREDVPELLARSHMLIISSRTEGFSLVAVEGLYYSDILVSKKVGISSEILPEELLVTDNEFAAAVGKIHDNYDYFVELFKKTKKEHQQRFLMQNTVNAYLQFYNKILQSG